MNILLIRGPANNKAIDLSHYTFSEPLGLQMLYSVLSEENSVEIFDMLADKTTLEKKLNEKQFDFCGISSACSDIFMIKDLARKIKKVKDIPIFIGGYQVKKTPELFKSKHIDFIMIETNKENLYKMTESVKRNNSTSKLKGVLRKSLNFEDCELREVEKTFEISRDSVKKYKKKYSYFIYKPVTLIEFYKKDTVCEELMEISEPYITFIDLDFFLDEKKVINFFKEIKTNKIQKKFLVYGSKKNLIKLESYYKFFKENGLDSIILFLDHKENDDSLLIEKLERSKINVWAYFNLSPNMDKNDFVKMRNYIKKLGVGVVTLYPEYPFYSEQAIKKYWDSLIFKREIRANRYPGYVLIKPFKMSLRDYYIEILKTSLYSYRFSIFKFFKSYGIRNSLRFFWKSGELLYKYLKIIVKLR